MWRCAECPPLPEEVRTAADLLGRRWTLAVLYASHTGARRFNQFVQAIGSVPPRTLAQRLAELEAAGILDRVVVPSRPPQVEYRLTDDGARLAALVEGLRTWSEQRARPIATRS
jgi:DNA-binding HxlR family transcriptional regulator